MKGTNLKNRFSNHIYTPLLFVLAFSIVFSLILYVAFENEEQKQKQNTIEIAEMIAQSVDIMLKGNLDYINLLAERSASHELSKDEFHQSIVEYIKVHPEFIIIVKADSNFVIEDIAPLEGKDHIIGMPVNISEPMRASRLAKEERRAVYTLPFESILSPRTIQVWTPVFSNDRFLGLLAGVYSCDKILENSIPENLSKKIRVSILDENDHILAFVQDADFEGLGDSHDIRLKSIPNGMSLRIEMINPSEYSWLMILLFALIIIMAIGLTHSLYKVSRENKLRNQAQKILEKNEIYLKNQNQEYATLYEKNKSQNENLRNAKQKAEEDRAYINMLFSSVPVGLALTSLDGSLKEINAAYAQIIGYSIEETLKLSYWDITPKKYEANEQEQLERLDKKGVYGPYEKEYIHKSGALIPVRLSGRIIEKEGRKYIWSTVEDISDKVEDERRLKKQYEEYASLNKEYRAQNKSLLQAFNNLEESEIRFKALHNASFGGITIHDKGVILECNNGLSTISGFPIEELIGMDGLLLIAEEDRGKVMSNILAEIETSYEVNGLRKNGDIYPLRLEARMIPYKGRTVRVVEFRDITEQKNIENQLRIAKEDAEKSDHLKSAFLANMSHEIRTPMNGILGFAGLLKEPDLTGEEQQEYIRVIERSGARMLNIINDIVDISKLESGLMELNLAPSSIKKQMEYIYTFFTPEASKKNIKLSYSLSLATEETIIITDREKVFAILTNLVKNAVKYTDSGKIEFGCQKKGAFIEFYVKDTGIGIPQDRIKAVFERFIQADLSDTNNQQGAGLGLAITKAYVELLGGEIWLESEKNKGSTFYFNIPYVPS
ncbi:PAS domain S-box protein [Lentimicrobium sp. S6]|uniref:PAS domain S-box protein n=1 Tax=Lentimicrobium sp. S6 TaxID=2735872 RepID=UPI001557EA4C|nr:PAS domain S-box protein [Lentimicrobium sp. S6]NPD44615.1 PAS domain S-box protein [Lentimicrobium sp. S6]